MVKVLKKSKKLVAFKVAKIQRSVLRAAKDAKIYPKEAKMLARKVAAVVSRAARRRKVVSTTTLRKAVLARVSKSSRDVAAAWRKFERRKR
jgi:transcriptional regulator NrdR family protein